MISASILMMCCSLLATVSGKQLKAYVNRTNVLEGEVILLSLWFNLTGLDDLPVRHLMAGDSLKLFQKTIFGSFEMRPQLVTEPTLLPGTYMLKDCNETMPLEITCEFAVLPQLGPFSQSLKIRAAFHSQVSTTKSIRVRSLGPIRQKAREIVDISSLGSFLFFMVGRVGRTGFDAWKNHLTYAYVVPTDYSHLWWKHLDKAPENIPGAVKQAGYYKAVPRDPHGVIVFYSGIQGLTDTESYDEMGKQWNRIVIAPQYPSYSGLHSNHDGEGCRLGSQSRTLAASRAILRHLLLHDSDFKRFNGHITIIGFSFGGALAIDAASGLGQLGLFATASPFQLDQVIIGSTFDSIRGAIEENVKMLESERLVMPAKCLNEAKKILAKHGKGLCRACIRAILPNIINSLKNVGKIRAPTVYIHGKNDFLLSSTNSERLAQRQSLESNKRVTVLMQKSQSHTISFEIIRRVLDDNAGLMSEANLEMSGGETTSDDFAL